MQNIQRLLIAPDSSRKYLIKQDAMNLLLGIILCLIYIDYLINDKLPYSAAWFKCSYLFLLFASNLCATLVFILFMAYLYSQNKFQMNSKKISIQTISSYMFFLYLNQQHQIKNKIKKIKLFN